MSTDVNTFGTSVEAPPEGGASHFGDRAWGKLCVFAQMLCEEGERRGLVGPRELDRLWSRHILNCTAITPDIPQGSTVADIGSGAGFPGIVAAIVRPDLNITLIETMDRRVQWLNEVKEKLGLENVRVVNARAEDLVGQYSFEYVTARAVAPMKKLVPLAFPLLRSGGSLLALKGARAQIELDAAETTLKKYKALWVDVYDCDVWGTSEGTRVVEARKR